MFGGATADDRRTALERAGEGRSKTDVTQKPPGSNGGLFDAPEAHREQPGLFGGEEPVSGDADALRAHRDGKDLPPDTIARLTDKGLLEHEPGFDRARITDAAHDMALDLIRAQADDPTHNAATRKLLDSFYRKNGHIQWTDAGRVAAVKSGQRFIAELANDLTSSSARTRVRAAGYLRELGAKDPDSFGAQVRAGVPDAAALRNDSGFTGDYATALMRFADQTVMNPTRATKPGWVNHPLGGLLFAVQSFNSTFGKNVLMRVARQTRDAVKDQDAAKLRPAAGLVALTAVSAVTQAFRHALFGGATGDQEESGFHYAMELADRAQLFGSLSMEVNAVMGLRYRRSLGDAMQGAVIGRSADALTKIGKLIMADNPDTNTDERGAAGAVYDLAVKPSIDALGAGVLRGPIGTAAIMGTGGRSSKGMIPSDREAFVNATAGPKPEPDD